MSLYRCEKEELIKIDGTSVTLPAGMYLLCCAYEDTMGYYGPIITNLDEYLYPGCTYNSPFVYTVYYDGRSVPKTEFVFSDANTGGTLHVLGFAKRITSLPVPTSLPVTPSLPESDLV